MAVDVLLTHSYHLPYDPKQVRKMQPYMPLATLYCASALRRAGLSVALFDTMLTPPEQFAETLRRTQPAIVLVYEDDFNFLSKMCLSRMREICFQMAEDARSFGAIPIAHGSDATDNASAFLARGFEYLIIGEGETTSVELITALRSSCEVRNIPGIAYQDQQGTVRTTARALERNLDSFRVPARDLVDVNLYREAWVQAHGRFSMNLIASRGCPFRCNWCAKPIFGDAYHSRSAVAVAEELSDLHEQYGAEHAWFADDIFGINRHWIGEFSRAMQTRSRIPFKVQARADLITAELANLLAAAGCEEIWVGVESGSQRVLDSMQKGLTIEEVWNARYVLAQSGIRVGYFIQLGYPGEQWDDIVATAKLVRESRPDDIGVSVSYPLPNTTFYRNVQEQLGAKRNWHDSDDLSVIFRGTYTDYFYRQVRDALHMDVVGDAEATRKWAEIELMERGQRRPDATFLPPVLYTRGMGDTIHQILPAGDRDA